MMLIWILKKNVGAELNPRNVSCREGVVGDWLILAKFAWCCLRKVSADFCLLVGRRKLAPRVHDFLKEICTFIHINLTRTQNPSKPTHSKSTQTSLAPVAYSQALFRQVCALQGYVYATLPSDHPCSLVQMRLGHTCR